MKETLQDAKRYKASTTVVLAGDFNMDVSAGDVAQAITRADFQDAFRNQHAPTTPNSFFADGRVIDWIFSRGSLRPDTPQVHSSVSCSDHYALSVTLDFR
jgi:endonuclease/exonuclease/phosphatase family metal-dependent hydrolase